MKHFRFAVMAFIVLGIMTMLWALPAFAAESAPNPVGDALAHLLSANVFPLIAAALSALVGIVLDKIRKKYNLDISAKHQEQLEAFARQGIALAEEKAAAFLKANATRLTGQNKLDLAISHVIAMSPAITIEQADALVHSVLARTVGTGATGLSTV